MPTKSLRSEKSLGLSKPFASISAACRLVGGKYIMVHSDLFMISDNQAKLTRCVFETCRIVLLFPFTATAMAA